MHLVGFIIRNGFCNVVHSFAASGTRPATSPRGSLYLLRLSLNVSMLSKVLCRILMQNYIYKGKKKKIQCTLVRALRLCTGRAAHMGSRGIAVFFLDHGTIRGEGSGGQRHAPAALLPGKTRYPLYRRLGVPQDRSGQVRNISPPPGFDSRTVRPVAGRYTDYATQSTKSYL